MKHKLATGIPILLLIFSFFVVGCGKPDSSSNITIPAQAASFIGNTGSFDIGSTGTQTFKIPIGLTAKSDKPTLVTVSVKTPNGADATSGSGYNIPSTTITVPAGQVLDSLPLTAQFDAYNNNKVDTLIFKIVTSDGSVASLGNATYTLYLRQKCDLDLDMFAGNAVINDPFFAEGTYNVTLSRSGNTLTVSNWGNFGPNIKINLTVNPEARTVKIEKQVYTPSVPGSTYTNWASETTEDGKIDACAKKITFTSIKYTVTGGSFGAGPATISMNQ